MPQHPAQTARLLNGYAKQGRAGSGRAPAQGRARATQARGAAGNRSRGQGSNDSRVLFRGHTRVPFCHLYLSPPCFALPSPAGPVCLARPVHPPSGALVRRSRQGSARWEATCLPPPAGHRRRDDAAFASPCRPACATQLAWGDYCSAITRAVS